MAHEFTNDLYSREGLLVGYNCIRCGCITGTPEEELACPHANPVSRYELRKLKLLQKLADRSKQLFDNKCEICGSGWVDFKLAYIFKPRHCRDFKLSRQLDPTDLPDSVYKVENALKVCLNCHYLFVEAPTLKIKPSGELELYGIAAAENYCGSQGKYVPWKKYIGKPGWPSKRLLELSFNYALSKRGRKRKINQDNQEGSQSID